MRVCGGGSGHERLGGGKEGLTFCSCILRERPERAAARRKAMGQMTLAAFSVCKFPQRHFPWHLK